MVTLIKNYHCYNGNIDKNFTIVAMGNDIDNNEKI